MKTLRRQLIAKKHHGHHTSSPNLKLPESKRVLWGGGAALVLLFALAYYFLMPVAEPFSAGRGAIGKSVEKGQLLATIADEETARELKQARADLQAAVDRAALPLASSELLKAAEDNLQRLEKVVGSGNVPAVEYQKARSEANRLRGAVETERIERDRNLNSLEGAPRKLESQMKNSEVRAPIDGLLTNVQTINGELVSDGNELFTVSSHN